MGCTSSTTHRRHFCRALYLQPSDDKLFLVIAALLRRFNQNHQWDVRKVLPIGGFFMSSPHLHHSDKKFRCKAKNGMFREIKEIREYRVLMSFGFNSKRLLKFLMFPKFLKLSIAPLLLH